MLQKQNHEDKVLAPSNCSVTKQRSCYACGSITTYITKDGYEEWFKGKDGYGYLCKKCYHAKRLVFRLLGKRKQIQLKENPRTGQCQICGLEIGDSYINSDGKKAVVKQTQIHHFAYHADDPLKDTIELCGHCHSKESYRLGQLTGLVKGWRRSRSPEDRASWR